MAWCRRASSSVPHTEGEVAQQHLTVFGPVRTVCDRSPMTVRGGGVPRETTALIADVKNGSAASELRCRCASLHHGLGLWDPPNTRMWRRMFVHKPRAPLLSSSRPQQVCRRARSHQGRAFGGANAPSLTAPARAGSLNVWVGTKKRAARSQAM